MKGYVVGVMNMILKLERSVKKCVLVIPQRLLKSIRMRSMMEYRINPHVILMKKMSRFYVAMDTTKY